MTGLPRALVVTPAGRRALRTLRKGEIIGEEPALHRLCPDCGQITRHRRIIHRHGQNTIGIIVCNRCRP